jgi:drug/metabolite transporter (DMT)-like permease
MDLPRVLVLVVTLLSMGLSGPTIRYAAAPALAVVLWRVAFSFPPLALGAVLARRAPPLLYGAAAGAFLAGHWIAWVVSVQLTSLASASVLIDTGVLWAAILSRPLLGEPVTRRQWLGLALALAGVSLVVTAHHAGRHSLLGDAVALAGAFAWTAYSFVGRRARTGGGDPERSAGFWAYTATVYGAVGLIVLAAALATRTPLAGFDQRTWLALGALGLFPTLLGHGGLNYLLRYLGPARLGLFALVEPVVATLAAWPLFGETLYPQTALGVVLALGGVGLGGTAGGEPPGASSRGQTID